MPPACAICSSYQVQKSCTCSTGSVPSGTCQLPCGISTRSNKCSRMNLHVALQLVGLHRVILVEIERNHIGKRQPLFAMHPHQLVVDADGRVARRQTQDAVTSFGRALTNQIRNLPRHGLIGLRRMRKHAHGNTLALGERIRHFVCRGASIVTFRCRRRFDSCTHREVVKFSD